MSSVLDSVRVEVAFDADPNTTTPAFRDLTSRARMVDGISISRGRQRLDDDVQPGSCSLTLENLDGALTPGLASSPFYPNVNPQNRVRVTYRDPAVDGNLLTANAASMETGVADWASTTFFGSYTLCTFAQSAVRAWDGAKSLLITWPTTAIGSICYTAISGMVIGRTYTFSAYVYVPTGSPDVWLSSVSLFAGPYTSVKDAWVRVSATWTATQTTAQVGIRCASASAGQQCWVDGAQVDEGPAVRTFTTADPPIIYRYDGYVSAWPTQWPTGGQSYSASTVTCYDLAARLARRRTLGSVIAETYRLNGPLWHFPLSEGPDSTSAGDIAGSGGSLAVEQVGSGGTLDFGSGTGPPTDGASAPMWTPASSADGRILTGAVPANSALTFAVTLEACMATSTVAAQAVVYWSDRFGISLELDLDATGKAVARYYSPWGGGPTTVTSSAGYADGETHTIAATLTGDGASSSTITLYVDGANVGSTTFATNGWVPIFTRLSVGGTRGGAMFTGTIAHVAAFGSALTAGQIAEHRAAARTGFTGERTDQRIARISSWVGLPAGLQALDVGLTTVAHVDSTGMSPWAYMHDVAHAEAGTLFVSTDGRLTFHARSRSYDTGQAVTVSITADEASSDTALEQDVGDVVNIVTASRPGGATIRVTDEASIDAYGESSTDVQVVVDTDAELYSRATWLLGSESTPTSKLSRLSIDALTVDTAAGARSLEIGQRVQVTGMPSQAPASSFDLRVLGYSEEISISGWGVVANTSEFMPVAPFILDDPVMGVLDVNSLVY